MMSTTATYILAHWPGFDRLRDGGQSMHPRSHGSSRPLKAVIFIEVAGNV